jgi:hypothetical protein
VRCKRCFTSTRRVKKEAEHHSRELKKAAENLRNAIPTVEVSGYFVDFKGIYEADLNAVYRECY